MFLKKPQGGQYENFEWRARSLRRRLDWKQNLSSDSAIIALDSIGYPCFFIIKTALRILGTLPVTSFS